jgi:acetoacetyl-CoA synthetase
MSGAAAPRVHPPDPERLEHATLERFRAWAAERHGIDLPDYAALHAWSVDRLEEFWSSVAAFSAVRWHAEPERVLGTPAEQVPGAAWFPGATLNLAEHVLEGRDPEAVALRHASELRPLDTWTWGRLRDEVARIARGLRADGVRPGDRVVAYLPNVPEAMAGVLACAAIGATWSSCSPDFGPRAVLDRFGQIAPTVLLAVDGYRYNGRDFDRLAEVRALQDELPSLRRTVLLPYLDAGADPGALRDGVAWADYGRAPAARAGDAAAVAGTPAPATGVAGAGSADADPTYAPVPFDHPLWVLYSSGTTGLPKAIVQGQGGILLEHLKLMTLHLDARDGDRVFWFTTTGWMMWNFLVGVLLTPAEVVLWDGSPSPPDDAGAPDLTRLWQLAADAGVTTFGTSAAFLQSCAKAGVRPREGRDLSALRAIGSTGSPLSPEGFRWVYDELGDDVWLFSTSGGTDVCSAFVGGVPTLPVVEGRLQAPALGAALEAWDEQGAPVPTGQVGELVLTRPMPSMPLRLWGDEDGSRLNDAYFDHYPGVWRHGDWLERTPDGGAVLHGRSDATINRGGVRMGTSEIYAGVLGQDEVVDALVVDLPDDAGGSTIELFVVLRDGATLDDGLRRRIARAVRETASPRHVPDVVVAVDAVPRTLSGKVLEVPVKRILMGRPAHEVVNPDNLQDPAALEWFVAHAAGRGG